MDWEDVRLFLAVYRAGNISAAAPSLGVSRVTVGRRVAALEARLGRLFEREREGYVPTPLGVRLLAGAEAMEEGMQDLARTLRQLGHDGAVVRLAVPPAFVEPILDLVTDLRDAHPGLVVDVLDGQQLVSLRRREADLALRIWRSGTVPGSGEAIIKRLGRLAWYFHASPALVQAHGLRAPLDRTERLPLVSYSGRSAYVPGAAWLEAHMPGAEPVLVANNLLTVLGAVRRGIGIGALPGFLARRAGLVPLSDAVEHTDVWIAVHPALRDNVRVRALKGFLEARLGDWFEEPC